MFLQGTGLSCLLCVPVAPSFLSNWSSRKAGPSKFLDPQLRGVMMGCTAWGHIQATSLSGRTHGHWVVALGYMLRLACPGLPDCCLLHVPDAPR